MANYIFSYDERVYNIAGTSHCRPPDGSWKKYWLRKSGRQWPEKCRIWECKNLAYGGAHVLIQNKHDYYILPTQANLMNGCK